MTIRIDKRRCPENHPCPALRVCPVKALSQQGYAAPKVDDGLCIDCGRCTQFCPMGVLQDE
jgi:Fe-S-cluster-containing hydrogenase component 2